MGIEAPSTRKIFVNESLKNEALKNEAAEYLDNSISTSKYTVVSFFPKVSPKAPSFASAFSSD